MLGVINHLATLGDQKRNRIGKHRQVFRQLDPQHFTHMKIPRLANHRADRRQRISQSPHPRVVLGGYATTPSHPKGRHLDVLEIKIADRVEVLGVLRVRQRIAALDVVEAKRIQTQRDLQLVLEREIDPLALAAVSQRRVVDLDAWHQALTMHCVSNSKKNASGETRTRGD